MRLLGRHMPRSTEALQRAQEIGCDAVQIFVTNPRAWQAPGPDPERAAEYRAMAARYDQQRVVVHAAYLINLASPDDALFAKSVELLRATLRRAAEFGGSEVVFHVGSHAGSGEEAGLPRLMDGIRRVLDGAPEEVRLLLENDTGGGGKLGARFENLARVLAGVPEHATRLGFCLDTAHLWAAGFDIGTPEGAERVLREADEVLGLERVPVIHVNDAREPLGSHRDIHARLGEGTIPLHGLQAFLRAPGLARATALLETPLIETQPGRYDWAAERAHIARGRALADLPMPQAPGEPSVVACPATNHGA